MKHIDKYNDFLNEGISWDKSYDKLNNFLEVINPDTKYTRKELLSISRKNFNSENKNFYVLLFYFFIEINVNLFKLRVIDDADSNFKKFEFLQFIKDRDNNFLKDWQERNPERVKEYSKEYYHENKEEIKKNLKIWRSKNQAKIKKYTQKWIKDNPDKVKAYAKSNRARHKERYNAKDLVYNRNKSLNKKLTIITSILKEIDTLLNLSIDNFREKLLQIVAKISATNPNRESRISDYIINSYLTINNNKYIIKPEFKNLSHDNITDIIKDEVLKGWQPLTKEELLAKKRTYEAARHKQKNKDSISAMFTYIDTILYLPMSEFETLLYTYIGENVLKNNRQILRKNNLIKSISITYLYKDGNNYKVNKDYISSSKTDITDELFDQIWPDVTSSSPEDKEWMIRNKKKWFKENKDRIYPSQKLRGEEKNKNPT